MLSLSPEMQVLGAKLALSQNQTGREHYWAIDSNNKKYRKKGVFNHVVLSPALDAATTRSGSKIRYHHSHPDERALSYSDLSLLNRIGVAEVWTHCVGGSSYGAVLRKGISGNYFQQKLDGLYSHFGYSLAQYASPQLTPDEYEGIRDLAACEALDRKGLIHAHIRMSDEARRYLMPNLHKYVPLCQYYESVL